MRRSAAAALAGALALTPPPLGAQQPTVVRAARYLDVSRGALVAPAVIVVDAGRIVAVNPASPPPGAATLDLGEVTLLPGLIDLHTHLTGDLEGDWVNAPVKETPADWAIRGVRNAHRTIRAGFTTVRDVGAGGFSDVALARGIDGGLVEGPRMFPSGHAIGITGGHCDVTGFAPGIAETDAAAGVADGPEGVLRAVRYQIKHGAKVIKICATAGVLSFEGPVGAQQMSADEMRAVVEEAGRHGLRVAAHAHGAEGIIAAARAGVVSVEHASILTDEAVRVLKERGTWSVPNLYLLGAVDTTMLPPPIRAKMAQVGKLALASFQRSLRGGVKIAFGTDAGVYPHGDNAKELGARVRAGMTPIEAIRGATSYAAEVLGVDDRGVIGSGKLADLIAVRGDPLGDVTTLERVVWVMKGGVVVGGERAGAEAEANQTSSGA